MKKKYISAVACVMALALSACGAGSGMSEAPAASSAPAAAAESGVAETESAVPSPGSAWDGAPEGDDSQGERYLVIDENRRIAVDDSSMLTFSLKVDTASHTNVARYIENGQHPPADAVRTEELINYFSYDGDMVFDDGPFAVYTEVAPSPFDDGKYIAFTRVKARDPEKESLPPANLTFLIDTSGSMESHDKLPLLREAFGMLVETLDERDTVSIVTYAGSSEVVLDSVSGDRKDEILRALSELRASGSTAGAQGIQTAYELAAKNLDPDGNNRVILATDGDFNVGISNTAELERFIAEKRDTGVYLSILGFGTGNLRDDMMETLSKHGNGNYAYIRSVRDAQKVLVDELGSNLYTVADDVKAQVEFNPENVKSYRLIGYENRAMENRDFDDDTKDAGEIGMGTDVVVLFELELRDPAEISGSVSPYGDELMEVRIRYKDPGQSESRLLERPVTFDDIAFPGSDDLRFACAVAAFGDVLRGSGASRAGVEEISQLAKDSLGADPKGYRLEFLLLLRQYEDIS